MTMKLIGIAAVDKSGAIGSNGGLLYNFKEDLQRFKKLTTGHTIVMGRKTFQSLPNGALPNRENIVLTTNTDFKAENCKIIYSVTDLLSYLQEKKIVYIIGGASIYTLLMDYMDELELTEISNTSLVGDTFFPNIDHSRWELIRDERGLNDPIVFKTYKRLK